MAEINLAELDRLEKRERQLSILSAVIVLVMASGVALLMYPLVFVHPDVSDKWTLRFSFIGFIVLSILLVIYLLDRHRTVRKLKQHLVSELKRNFELRQQASVDLLESLPDKNNFDDRLMMEFRRASNLQVPLSLLAAKIKIPANAGDANAEKSRLGEAARTISHHLRSHDSMYVLGKGLLGVLLAETDTTAANRIKMQMEEALKAAGSGNKFSALIYLWNYPDHVKSARELDEHVASLLPEGALVGKL